MSAVLRDSRWMDGWMDIPSLDIRGGPNTYFNKNRKWSDVKSMFYLQVRFEIPLRNLQVYDRVIKPYFWCLIVTEEVEPSSNFNL